MNRALLFSWHLICVLVTPILKRLRFNVVFAVNVGTSNYALDHLPKGINSLYAKKRPFKTAFIPVGFLLSKKFRALVVISNTYNNEFSSASSPIEPLMLNLLSYKANRYALGAALPSAYERNHQLFRNTDIVSKHAGFIFLMLGCIEKVISTHGHLRLKERPVAIVGAGYSGHSLAVALNNLDFEVSLFDVRPTTTSTNVFVNRFSEIANAGLVILLSTDATTGLRSVKPYLKPSMALLSNAFPPLSLSDSKDLMTLGVESYEAYCTVPGLKVFPGILGHSASLIGGCYIQAHVESLTNKYYENDYLGFSQDANALGVTPVIRPV